MRGAVWLLVPILLLAVSGWWAAEQVKKERELAGRVAEAREVVRGLLRELERLPRKRLETPSQTEAQSILEAWTASLPEEGLAIRTSLSEPDGLTFHAVFRAGDYDDAVSKVLRLSSQPWVALHGLEIQSRPEGGLEVSVRGYVAVRDLTKPQPVGRSGSPAGVSIVRPQRAVEEEGDAAR